MTREWLIYHSNEYTYQSRLIKRGKLSLYHSNDHWEKGNKLMSVMSKWTREEIFSCFALEHQERSTPREIKDLEIVLLLFPYHTLSIASQQRVSNTYITTVTLVSSVEGKKWLVVWITIRIYHWWEILARTFLRVFLVTVFQCWCLSVCLCSSTSHNEVCVLKRTPDGPGKPEFDCVGFDVDVRLRCRAIDILSDSSQHSIDILKTQHSHRSMVQRSMVIDQWSHIDGS